MKFHSIVVMSRNSLRKSVFQFRIKRFVIDDTFEFHFGLPGPTLTLLQSLQTVAYITVLFLMVIKAS
jgi:hypothetical protein